MVLWVAAPCAEALASNTNEQLAVACKPTRAPRVDCPTRCAVTIRLPGPLRLPQGVGPAPVPIHQLNADNLTEAIWALQVDGA